MKSGPKWRNNTGQAKQQRLLAHFQTHFLFFPSYTSGLHLLLPLKFGMIEFWLKSYSTSQFLRYDSFYFFTLWQLHNRPAEWLWKSLLTIVVKAIAAAAVAAKSLQSCLTPCNPIDSSPQVSPVPGILLARTLEWVAISFSNAWKWKVKVKSLSRVRLFATPWTAAFQAPPSMRFSRQEYWSGVK